jgi:hypothetical protein
MSAAKIFIRAVRIYEEEIALIDLKKNRLD